MPEGRPHYLATGAAAARVTARRHENWKHGSAHCLGQDGPGKPSPANAPARPSDRNKGASQLSKGSSPPDGTPRLEGRLCHRAKPSPVYLYEGCGVLWRIGEIVRGFGDYSEVEAESMRRTDLMCERQGEAVADSRGGYAKPGVGTRLGLLLLAASALPVGLWAWLAPVRSTRTSRPPAGTGSHPCPRTTST